jgi:uncharacterized protein
MLLRVLTFLAVFVSIAVIAQVATRGNDASGAPASNAKAGAFKELQWDELVPKGWDPFEKFKGANMAGLIDGTPRAAKAMRELRETLDQAPTVPELNGTAVKVAGYLVPLDEVKGDIQSFLLVPYFGACIHTPPPPANQIIHVVAAKPIKGFRSMDAVWVSGKLGTQRQDSAMGTSGYRLDATVVEPYAPPYKP